MKKLITSVIFFVTVLPAISTTNCGTGGCTVCERLQCYQSVTVQSLGWPTSYTLNTYNLQCNNGYTATYTSQVCNVTIGSSTSSSMCSGNRECWCDYGACGGDGPSACYSTCPSVSALCGGSTTTKYSSNYNSNASIYSSSTHLSSAPSGNYCGSTASSIISASGCPGGYFAVCSGQYASGVNSQGTIYYNCD